MCSFLLQSFVFCTDCHNTRHSIAKSPVLLQIYYRKVNTFLMLEFSILRYLDLVWDFSASQILFGTLALVKPSLRLFPSCPRFFLAYFSKLSCYFPWVCFLSFCMLFLCLLLPLSLLFSYLLLLPVWIHTPCTGSPVPAVRAKLSRVFLSFLTSSSYIISMHRNSTKQDYSRH